MRHLRLLPAAQQSRGLCRQAGMLAGAGLMGLPAQRALPLVFSAGNARWPHPCLMRLPCSHGALHHQPDGAECARQGHPRQRLGGCCGSERHPAAGQRGRVISPRLSKSNLLWLVTCETRHRCCMAARHPGECRGLRAAAAAAGAQARQPHIPGVPESSRPCSTLFVSTVADAGQLAWPPAPSAAGGPWPAPADAARPAKA